ncbi:phosphotransferase family protein [Paenibacillus sp. A14]|uniref:phosphotransferase family protein n=1 Tax=Paenibacillus sp. A14 TaxID=3119820 RepID=UPI002FDF93B4
MENAIKRQLSRQELEALVDRAFQGHRTLAGYEELKDGWFNSAYALTCNDGLKAVLKVAPRSGEGMMSYERDVMKAEVEVLRLLKEDGSVPVPEVYYDEIGNKDGEWFLMQFIAGDPYNKVKESLASEERAQIEEELGRMNQRINRIRGERFGYYAREEHQGKDWPTVFTDMVSGLLKDAREKRIKLPADEEAILNLLGKREASLAEVTVPSLVHWDLWDGNVFVKDGRITALIDCERALWGDPLMEFYFRAIAGGSQAFFRGYGKETFTSAERERMKLYDLYLAFIFHIECYYRQFSDVDHLRWAQEHLADTWNSVNG